MFFSVFILSDTFLGFTSIGKGTFKLPHNIYFAEDLTLPFKLLCAGQSMKTRTLIYHLKLADVCCSMFKFLVSWCGFLFTNIIASLTPVMMVFEEFVFPLLNKSFAIIMQWEIMTSALIKLYYLERYFDQTLWERIAESRIQNKKFLSSLLLH